MRFAILLISTVLLALTACHKKLNKHFTPYAWANLAPPAAPDYSNDNHWAALPWTKDSCDQVPQQGKFGIPAYTDNQATAQADVFFIHPTTFLRKDSFWNADLNDTAINLSTDAGTIKHQASVFNGSCRIFAPRYRQGHLKSYWHVNGGGREALMFAYNDVRTAFLYYMEHYNEGRPVIIASHSQGSTHAIFLLQEFFDGTPLQEQLITAYIVGMPVHADSLKVLPPCDNPEDLHCYNTWCTFGKGFEPMNYDSFYRGAIVTNPTTWRRDSTFNDREAHQFILYKNFTPVFPHSMQARVGDGILEVRKPHVWFRWLMRNRSYHIADYNLFWGDIRENVDLRVKLYLEARAAEEQGEK